MFKILISETVKNELLSIFKSQKIIDILINKIKNKNIENIYLKRPFVKIKVSIFNDTFRIVWEYRKIKWTLVFILIFKKSNKKYWNNLTWSKEIENLTINMLSKIKEDILNKTYKIY